MNEPKYPRLSEKDFLEEMEKISVQYCNEKITKKERAILYYNMKVRCIEHYRDLYPHYISENNSKLQTRQEVQDFIHDCFRKYIIKEEDSK